MTKLNLKLIIEVEGENLSEIEDAISRFAALRLQARILNQPQPKKPEGIQGIQGINGK